MALKFINEDTKTIKEAVFCFTGKSPKTRPEMQAIAIKAGASVTKSVTSKTTILVIADANSTSNKAQKARSLGIDLISPEQFFMICNSIIPSSDEIHYSDEKKSLINYIHKDKVNQITIKKPTEKRKHSFVRRIEL